MPWCGQVTEAKELLEKMCHYGHCQEESEHPGGVHPGEEGKADNGVNGIKHL